MVVSPMGGQGNNRRALLDVGNILTPRPLDHKPLPEITRPEQKEATVNKNVRTHETEITEEENKPESSSRRNTSTLTARSKAACRLNYKSKSKSKSKNIIDIDAADIDNELAVVEYVEDMYKFYKLIENETQVHDYMNSQPEINNKFREILIDWLIDIHWRFGLTNETLYLTINIVDRFLAAETVTKRELACLGVTAMLIASKYEEILSPEVKHFVRFSGGVYGHKHMLVMEKRILGRLEWNLTVPTPYVFLTRFIKAAVASPETITTMENMVYFYAELGMMHYQIIRFCPSMVAAGAVYAARATMNESPVWHETLEMHTGFTEAQVMECARMMVEFHSLAKTDEKKMGIYQKYMDVTGDALSLYPPAKALLSTTSSSS